MSNEFGISIEFDGVKSNNTTRKTTSTTVQFGPIESVRGDLVSDCWTNNNFVVTVSTIEHVESVNCNIALGFGCSRFSPNDCLLYLKN